jgi:hypothetical protein
MGRAYEATTVATRIVTAWQYLFQLDQILKEVMINVLVSQTSIHHPLCLCGCHRICLSVCQLCHWIPTVTNLAPVTMTEIPAPYLCVYSLCGYTKPLNSMHMYIRKTKELFGSATSRGYTGLWGILASAPEKWQPPINFPKSDSLLLFINQLCDLLHD